MNSKFKLPIFYLENKEMLDSNIIDDLELLELNDESEERKCLLEAVIQPKSKIGIESLPTLCEYYTNNKLYLKQTQKIIQAWKPDEKLEFKQKQYDDFYELWKNIKNDENFADRYYYVDVNFFKFLNHSSPFLQLLSIYNLVSPILSLILVTIMILESSINGCNKHTKGGTLATFWYFYQIVCPSGHINMVPNYSFKPEMYSTIASISLSDILLAMFRIILPASFARSPERNAFN